jgi:two-component system phosphate regulon response regulator PhoB/two-component system alkaline phosphatase synthesis response regulator PhoP
MHELIAVIDDEIDITRLIALHLKKENFKVREFHDAKSFYLFLNESFPELLILDLMLPDENGLEICKRLKRESVYSSIPIIMLTAKAEETDRIIGLELGADDYVIKPFSPKELVARVKAVLRRKKGEDYTKKITIGDFLEMDLTKYTVTVNGKTINLTTTEFKILQLLGSKIGWVFSRDSILNHLWGHDKYVIDRTVDVHIRHIREKLGNYNKIIKNVRGIGYKLEL